MLLTLLKEFIFTGVSGNLAYDALQNFWQQTFGKSLEDLYLDAFTAAFDLQKPSLRHYGGFLDLDRADLRRVLHTDLSLNLDQATLSSLSESVFIRCLAEAMTAAQVLIIGGHSLSKEEYRKLMQNLITRAGELLREQVLQNEAAFNRVLLAEVQNNRTNFDAVKKFLEDYFDAVLHRLEAIETNTARLPEMDNKLDTLNYDLQTLKSSVQTLTDTVTGYKNQQAQGNTYNFTISGGSGFAIGDGAQVFNFNSPPPAADPRPSLRQQQNSLATELAQLDERAVALQRDLSLELDGERKVLLKIRLKNLDAERAQLAAQLDKLEQLLA